MKKVLAFLGLISSQIAWAVPIQPMTYSVSAVPMIAGAAAMVGTSINRNGDVAGYAYMQSGGQQAYSSIQGHTGLIPTLGGIRSAAYGINDAGQVVGWSETASDGKYRPFLFSDGAAPANLGTLGGSESFASGINNAGVVVGYSGTQSPFNGPYSAFTVSAGSPPVGTSFGSLGLGASSAYGINDSNAITGSVYSQDYTRKYAFIQDANGIKILDTLGSIYATGTSINNAGQVTGYMTLADGQGHAFFYDGANVTDLGTIAGPGILGYGLGTTAVSTATDINDFGTIVGTFGYSGYSGHGFVDIGGQMFDLNELIESNSTNRWVITDAMGINNNGTIVAYGYKQGEFVGTTLLLSPNNVPEPATASLVLLGFFGMALRRAPRADKIGRGRKS